MTQATSIVDIWVLIVPQELDPHQLPAHIAETNMVKAAGVATAEDMLASKVCEGAMPEECRDCGYPDAYYYAFLVNDGGYNIPQEILKVAVDYSMSVPVEGEVHKFPMGDLNYDIFYISWLE